MKSSTRVAVLGAGIMGCSVALYLARRGVPVTLMDQAGTPMSGASRWNEGKIHLGYMYSADPSLDTAQRMIEGGLWFRPLIEELLACDLSPAISHDDDVYLCHRDSVVAPGAMAGYLHRVSERLREHPAAGHYLVDASDATARALSAADLEALSGADAILAGFRVPERSVQTRWVADRFVDAVTAEPSIQRAFSTRVLGVESATGSDQGPWQITTTRGSLGPFSHVVNALWEGRPAVDHSAGLPPDAPWTHRYRLALFLRTARALTLPCAVVATGPFGDVKNYNGRDFYLSWYPAGLVVEGTALTPPMVGAENLPDSQSLTNAIFDALGALLPDLTTLRAAAETIEVGGGWVFAIGQGNLSDPAATLHERSRFGIKRRGSYLSVDTGKYSTAPWMAREVAALLH
jgi:glycine/D-amino acid oxidase-like deaminating enzyme